MMLGICIWLSLGMLSGYFGLVYLDDKEVLEWFSATQLRMSFFLVLSGVFMPVIFVSVVLDIAAVYINRYRLRKMIRDLESLKKENSKAAIHKTSDAAIEYLQKWLDYYNNYFKRNRDENSKRKPD